MFLLILHVVNAKRRLLHACGDVSHSAFLSRPTRRSAPRMWRCFHSPGYLDMTSSVCSTHVEMFLSSSHSPFHPDRLLHACGDVSSRSSPLSPYFGSAPRMWRCFLADGDLAAPLDVCSTHVEMFPLGKRQKPRAHSLLHACGDVSLAILYAHHHHTSAPRMWRCFQIKYLAISDAVVCSTHVEMFLLQKMRFSSVKCLLHACGDVSCLVSMMEVMALSAPRMWRCF